MPLNSCVVIIICCLQASQSIHKNPMVGRPIAASHSYITRPLSIFADEYVKPRLKMPTVLRDSGELIQALESVRLPPHCFLLTANVISLYPNVDTKKALLALDLLLREAGAPETPLLIQFSRLVLRIIFSKPNSVEIFFIKRLGLLWEHLLQSRPLMLSCII